MKCEVCGKPTIHKCAKCWNAFYCCKEHQVDSWKIHQKICRPFKIASAFKSRIITSLIANKGDILDVNTFLEECKKLFAVRVLEYLNPTAKINFTLAAEYIIAHRQDIDPCIKYFSTRNFEICKDSDIDRYFDKVKQDILNKVCYNQQLGRHLIATKAIKEGDVILQELSLISCPNDISGSVCMGCSNNLGNKRSYTCSKCGWPVCGLECENNPNHAPECYYMVKRGKKVSTAELGTSFSTSVLALRCLYQKVFFPQIWKKINEQESHCNKSGNHEVYKIMSKSVTDIIYNIFGLKNEFSEAEIRKVCSILIVNSFELSTTPSLPFQTALFETASLLEHNCRANCFKAFNSNGLLRVIAGTQIHEGDHLSICYTNPLFPTYQRQEHLQQTKLFQCHCDRCTDVTEFGSYFSALRCPKINCEGIVLPDTFLVEELKWTCNKCKSAMAAYDAINTIGSLEFKIEMAIIAGVSSFKMFLKKQEKIWPNSSQCMILARSRLMTKIADATENDLKWVSQENLEFKITLCRQILEPMEIIIPADKLLSAYVMDHLQVSLGEMYRRETEKSDAKCYLPILEERKSLLEKIVQTYRYDFYWREKYQTANRQLEALEKLLKKYK